MVFLDLYFVKLANLVATPPIHLQRSEKDEPRSQTDKSDRMEEVLRLVFLSVPDWAEEVDNGIGMKALKQMEEEVA